MSGLPFEWARWAWIPVLCACTGPEVRDSSDTGQDTALPEQPEAPRFLLIAGDPTGFLPNAWRAWFEGQGTTVLHGANEGLETYDFGQSLTVLLPDLARDSKEVVGDWTSGGANVLAMGVGGARAYEGLDIGIGINDGATGTVDGLAVNDGFESDPVFTGVDLSSDSIVDVWQTAVTDVGIVPAAAGLEVLGWDDRYPGQYADLGHVDRYWFWGWGSSDDGTPDLLSAEGEVVWQNLIQRLAEP